MSEMNHTGTLEANENRAKLISDRINILRPKLLDLTRRNPLISTKFSERSNSLIRIVDEIPELLLKSLVSCQMRIVPLPDLGTDPSDEQTSIFQNSLAGARLNDEIYLSKLDEIDSESDEAPNLLAQTERELKDRLREQLNLPPRQTKNNLSLQQHAINHGISPNYELFLEGHQAVDGRHSDQDIQTLLLPDILERRLNALCAKEKTWKEETGISVLHAAFGFLEWEDGNNSSTQFSPLVLIPVYIDKKRTRNGQEFWVIGDETEVQENKILAEKLRLEFNIILPEYTNQGLEKYFEEVSKPRPKNMTWRIRRWATIGVFPSARLAMYHDLEPDGWDFASHEVVSLLFGGTETGHDALPFGEEYHIDEPEIESKVPFIIADVDSSQFSTIVDVASGKNLAVEGPPGTGKSQTIVNTIATSLSLGLKVLFVAEKSAALEVVGSRLDAYGIGNFLLPLQANRSGKEQVISSIRNRLEMKPCANPLELDHAVKQFKDTRQKLKLYVDILSSTYGKTDLTIYEVLGRSIKFTDLINNLPEKIKKLTIPDTKIITSEKLTDILSLCKRVEEAWEATLLYPDSWNIIQIPNIDPFLADELIDLAFEIATLFAEADKQRQSLIEFRLSPVIGNERLSKISTAIKNTQEISNRDIDIATKLTSNEIIGVIKNFLNEARLWRDKRESIVELFKIDLDSVVIEELYLLKELCLKYQIESLNEQVFESLILKYKKCLEDNIQSEKICNTVINISESLGKITVHDLIKMFDIISGISKQVLSVRKSDFDDPITHVLIEKQASQALALKKTRALLDEEFNLSMLPESELTNHHAETLRQSGLLSFFSKKYRQAKQFYKFVSKNKKFNRLYATQKLSQLGQWQLDVKVFGENVAMKNILGSHYFGIETDFSPFEEVISLFNYLDHEFSGPDYIDLRNFLKFADNEIIQSIPIIEKNHPLYEIEDTTLANVAERISVLQDQVKDCESDVIQLKKIIKVFNDSEKISKEQIIELPLIFEQLLKTRENLRHNDDIKGVLGLAYKAELTDEHELESCFVLATNLIELNENERQAFLYSAKQGFIKKLETQVSCVTDCDAQALTSLEKIAVKTNTMPERWLDNMTYLAFSKWMEQASKNKDGLVAYSRFISAKNNLKQDRYIEQIELILSEKYSNLCEIIEALITREMAREIYKSNGEILASYNGSNLDTLRKRLQEADRAVIKLSRQRLQSELYNKACPPLGIGFGRKSEFTELALLRNEISKKQRHIPIRNLTKRAARALLEIKPCWMMSPLAVAQYLPRGGVEFDLVIIDEASQMTPEDSVGALIRAKQAMVVGDTNQLPPTGFFRKMLEDESADEDEKVTEESILEMANASFTPARRLRWHYRSRHSGLISFSNKHVYNDDLVVFPSAQEDHPHMGISYIKVNGIYSSGTNPKEAMFMIDAIIDFMRIHTDKSLGVVLMNQKQRDLLLDEMNYALEQHPQAREYIERWDVANDGLESFFIKNLENVQGDERDVIFIGTVYGAEKEGAPVMQCFGPINGIAGKRRLNVLFSRAKERIVTFSSMTAADIRAEEESNPGVYMLKCWLEYSSSGILEAGQYTEKEPDSDFEEHVIKQIKSIGCVAIPQVGVKGYSIDIGIKHPDWPHGFIMGVECDGASYHSSRSARDRDRLRQEVLEGLGWNLYRIWSTDWFEDQRRETEKLRRAIHTRLSQLVN
ncbi:hypothetical protein Lqui_2554 [Legionella quinlivanii]|uniref:RAP domain-containing protein n=1 Tax=Legionella quinlivanii TaxID=45073 RepID=A0A0W0XNY9_9GAMM|nr:DUF4011 domain-containing protein [Legionella quinlivanii]KTD46064.1 hypothetical protein Lqui_2554 [Legionella quinlivanii]SEG06204.1 AAA domain-containing protein [Legionella quinlivanii DSM 21216]STY11532.1 putative DNA helicase [Legionella quinlivanii]